MAPQAPVLLLVGQRRTGKTSLIAYLPQRLLADVVPVRVNVQRAAAAATNAGLAYSLAQEIVDSARSGRNLILPAPALADFRLDPFVALSDWLGLAERTAKGRDFLLCLDEFQRLDEVVAATRSRAALNFLRDLLEHRPRWRLLLAGSLSAEEMAPYWSDTLINARRLQISYLKPEEARELIEHPVPGFEQQMRYDGAAREAIVELTLRPPHLVQLVCAELVDLLNREHRHLVRAKNVETIIPLALEHGGEYFDELWGTAAPAQRDVLRQIAAGTFRGGDTAVLAALCRRELLEVVVDGDVRRVIDGRTEGLQAARVVVGAQLGDEALERVGVPEHPRLRGAVSYTHLRAHETVLDLVCRLLLEKKKKRKTNDMTKERHVDDKAD